MFVHRSNRMEVLVRELARVISEPKLGPLEPETILIQSQGMERWLSRELSRRLGGLSNARFPFPRAFLREMLDAVLGPAPAAALYERPVMTFTLAALFERHAEHAAFAAVTRYLEGDRGAVRRLQLAERVAYLFDQYLIYRPELLLGWESGRERTWQAISWRALVEKYEPSEISSSAPRSAESPRSHFAARAATFQRRFSPEVAACSGLPKRLCIVGGVSLPPLFLQLLRKLSESIEVHLFTLAPSREYLGSSDAAHELAWSEEGGEVHPLLDALGAAGAALQQLLESELHYVEGSAEFVEPPPDSLLHALQGELLNNRLGRLEPSPGSSSGALSDISADDSMGLVSCHSPLREVEVLRDRLLAYFDEDESLRPDDVVVMAPRIDAYVPLIEAVFSGEPGRADSIPYRIADRCELRVNGAAEAWLRLLEVLRGRLRASEVLDLLQAEPVRRRFGIDASDLPEIQRWVHDTGIRWAKDADHRREQEVPGDVGGTWRFGLQRLLLGHALADDQRTTFAGVAPYDGVRGDELELLGRLVRFVEMLFEARALLSGEKSVVAFCEALRWSIRTFLSDDEGEGWQLLPLHAALHEVETASCLAGFDDSVSLETMENLLSPRFEENTMSADFVAGGVTFCSLLPLRSIPFRLVYLLGMNDGEFPRTERQLSFDVMAERPRLGDRSVRLEDRHLLLETILSARDRLILSYVGRGIADNEPRPPAVVVLELSRAVEGLFERSTGQPSSWAAAEHPLQPFSPRAFDGVDPRLASYSTLYARGAAALVGARSPPAPLFPELGQSLSADESLGSEARSRREAQELIELANLVRFFENPARALIRSLGLSLEEEAKLVEDRQPLSSDALTRYRIGSRWLAAVDSGADLGEQELAELGRGLLPAGAPGRVLLDQITERAQSLARAARRFTRLGAEQPVPVELRLLGSSIVGVLEDLYRNSSGELSMVIRTYAKLNPKRELAAWIRHLVGRAAGVAVSETILIGRSDQGLALARLKPVEAEVARELLLDLVDLYRTGHIEPLPFFPEISRNFARRVLKAPDDPGAERAALAAAERELTRAQPGSDVDVYVEWAFRGRQPLGEGSPSFAEASLRVFRPLLGAVEPLALEPTEDLSP